MPVNKSTTSGFAILYAVLVVSIVLTISLSLFNITYKQIVLSSVVRESQVAFYAADAARNCAVHWNSFRSVVNPFGFFDAGGNFNPPPGVSTFSCNGQAVNSIYTDAGGGQHISNFQLVFDVNDPIAGARQACALVQVIQDAVAHETTINSLGYNLYQAPDCPSPANNRVVERAWQKVYSQL